MLMFLYFFLFLFLFSFLYFCVVISQGDTHSSYETSLLDVKRLSETHGCPLSKIVLGLPFYGRGMLNPSLVLTYNDLVGKVGADLNPTIDVLGSGTFSSFSNDFFSIFSCLHFVVHTDQRSFSFSYYRIIALFLIFGCAQAKTRLVSTIF